jgi:hypothetical protein
MFSGVCRNGFPFEIAGERRSAGFTTTGDKKANEQQIFEAARTYRS